MVIRSSDKDIIMVNNDCDKCDWQMRYLKNTTPCHCFEVALEQKAEM